MKAAELRHLQFRKMLFALTHFNRAFVRDFSLLRMREAGGRQFSSSVILIKIKEKRLSCLPWFYINELPLYEDNRQYGVLKGTISELFIVENMSTTSARGESYEHNKWDYFFTNSSASHKSRGCGDWWGPASGHREWLPSLSFRMLNAFKNGLDGVKENTVT